MILRRSQWIFNTSAGSSIGYGPLNSETGIFSFRDTKNESHKYAYSGFGVGRTWGLSTLLNLPKSSLPKITIKNGELSGAGSTTDFTSTGGLFLTDACKGADLPRPESLEGGTIYLQGAGGYLLGGTGSLMFLGLSRPLLIMGIAKPEFIGIAIRSAPAALWMAGYNEGLQDSVGASFMFGHVDYKGLYEN